MQRLAFREVGVSRSFEAEIITEVFRDRVGHPGEDGAQASPSPASFQGV